MKTYSFRATADDVGERLDKFILKQLPDISRSHIKSVVEKGGALVNGKEARVGIFLKSGDEVVFNLPDVKALEAIPEDIPIDIVYEDDCLAVINKPQGMVVHPAYGSESGTLVNALLFKMEKLSAINGVIRPGIVHRLDKDTSGLLMIAKTDFAHRALSEAIKNKEAQRIYIALVDGNIKTDEGTISAPIGRSRTDRKKMAVNADGREAVTDYRVIERFGKYTLVEFRLHTGRTHQIRVHARHMGHPVVGDGVYGGSNAFKLTGQLLHARKLEFTHPESGKEMIFEADLPDYFQFVLDKLRK